MERLSVDEARNLYVQHDLVPAHGTYSDGHGSCLLGILAEEYSGGDYDAETIARDSRFSERYLLGLEVGYEDWHGYVAYEDDEEYKQGVKDGREIEETLSEEYERLGL